MYIAEFYIGGIRFFSNEHFFQYSKFIDTDLLWAREIMQTYDPFQARQLGRDRTHLIRQDWDYIKIDIMRIGLRAKFSARRDLGRILLATKNEPLIESTPYNLFWGMNTQTGVGQNMMGRCLMQVRSELMLLLQGDLDSNEMKLSISLLTDKRK